jgi:ABC-type Fe3+ transport system permease subunit
MSLIPSLLVGFAGTILGCALCVVTCSEPIISRRPRWTDWPLALTSLLLNVSGWIVAVSV